MTRSEIAILFGLGVIVGLAGHGATRAVLREPVRAACGVGEDCGCNSPKGCAMPCTGCCDGADPEKGCPPPPTGAR